MIRPLLLWASTNSWMAGKLPRRRFVQRAVGRFMPGEGREDAIRAAKSLRAKRIPAVFTLLGENVVSSAGAAEAIEEYEALLSDIDEQGLDAEISVKLTQLGLDQGEELAFEALLGLASRAREVGSFIWIDMEDSSYKATTLRLFSRGIGEMGPSSMGLCLQAYLLSTPADLEDLLPLGPTIRFVKGAYAEPPALAYPDRKDVDEAFFQLSTHLLDSSGRVAFATHDSTLIERLRAWIREHHCDDGSYEFQMLYGIRAEEQVRLAGAGDPVRVLISYGPAWFPWYMRRLAERPANIWFVLKNLFRA